MKDARSDEMISRKQPTLKEKIRTVTPRGPKLRKGVEFSELPDAIVEGKPVVKKGDKLAFERKLSGEEKKVHVGFVLEVDDDYMTIIDETRGGQSYLVGTKQENLPIKIVFQEQLT